MSITRKVKYRSDVFSDLSSEDKIRDALNEFGAVLNSNNCLHVLEDVLSQPSVLELVLSNLSSEIPLCEWMLASFPQNASLFLDSFPSKVLERLSTFFLLRSPQSIQPPGFASESSKFLTQTPQVLRALFAMTFVEETSTNKPKANSQRQYKQLRKLSGNVQYEDALIKADVAIPHTKMEALEIAENILNKLRNIYMTYLNSIRSPEISKSIRESLITIEAPAPLHVVVTKTNANSEAETVPAAPTSETAPSPLLHLKLSNYYDTPDGFGEWRILLSSRADGALRDLHRTESTKYEIIRRKLVDLSNGHFSYDNHKRLNGPKTEIPVYEAKMTGDLRLIYIVDCTTSPTNNQGETQVLKVFNFCTHAKMDHRLWESVAAYLQSRGKEYRSRCLKRHRRAGDNGDVYVPASFPAREEESSEDQDSDKFIGDLVGQDSNQLHSIITLEKYVALSKDVLESIEADLQGAFPFELSQYEKKIAEHPMSCYVLGRSGTGKTTTMLHKMLWVQRAYYMHTANTQSPRQVFVTRSAVLARKVEEHFSTYMMAGKINGSHASVLSSQSASNDLINQNDSSAWKDSKKTFKGLTDADFPLFIPLEDLYYLLEGDIVWDSKQSSTLASRFRPLSEYKGKSISFYRFLGEYWPTFSKRLTNKMSPALVFNEIIGVISGSEKTLEFEQGYLSKEKYLTPTRAASSNFTQEQRDTIYDIFALYLKLKSQKDDYDISDRSRTIIAALRYGALTIRKIDHLYVDETQDNLLIDALVLRLICRNPDGLFWAGDTAQTISAGSAFRFEELQSFMYRIEENRLKREAKAVKGGIVKQLSHTRPQVFQLATNFRSHAGIVDCAHIVVELIKEFFPSTIDVLKRERGVVEGAKPMFCSEFDLEQFREGGILSSTNMNGERIELGAHQCILVRDDAARERFLANVGDIGLVVTIYDSKGLEFNDVILLDFFEDSQLTCAQWCVVLNMAPDKPYAPKLDPIKHSAMCLELKSLYVAITRARNNLRIVDSSDKSKPMKTLWEKLGCITEATFQDAFKNFAVQSSPADWIKRAKELFDQEKYALSRDAFLRGQSYRHAAVASAYCERESAEKTPVQVSRNKSNLRSEKYSKAAEAFIRCADEADGENARIKYIHIAAGCFEEAGDLREASNYYRLAGDFTKSALLLRKLGLFDEVKDFMEAHKDGIQPEVLQNLKDVTRLFFVQSKDYTKVHELFDSPEDEIEYLEDRNLDLAQVDLFLHHGRIAEAATIHLADGRFNDAASLFISDSFGGTASLVGAVKSIIQGLRTYITLGSNPRNTTVAKLLALSDEIPVDIWLSDEASCKEIDMYRCLYSNEIGRLYDMVDGLLSRDSHPSALLILDYIFTDTPAIDELFEVARAARTLTYFSRYVELLHEAAFFVDPTRGNNPRLFGVVQNDADTFSFQPGTLIANFYARDGQQPSSILMKDDLIKVYRRCLQERLRHKVVQENTSCRRAPVFDPCLRHVALGDCIPSSTQCHRPHIATNHDWFRDWIRLHLLQVFIYDTARRLEMPEEAQRQQLFWMKKFHEAINPPHHAMGSLTCLTAELVNDMTRHFLTMQNWIREITESLKIHPDYRFLTAAMLSTDLAFIFDRKQASTYIYRSHFVRPDVIDPKYLRGRDQSNSLKELLLAFQGKGTDSLVMGVCFIRHVVEAEIKVDINVLCAFIERTCGLLIVHNTFVYRRSFHNITLPHSWLKRIINEFDHRDAATKRKDCFGRILEPLNKLIQRLYFGMNQPDRLLFGSKYSSIPMGIRKIYISRICRVLGLLGLNIRVDWFRDSILQIFKSLRDSQHCGFPRLYSAYIYSDTFEDVMKATRRSMIDSTMDEMVTLKDLQRVEGNQAPIRGVRRIMYQTEEDLATALGLAGLPVGLDNLGALEPPADDVRTHEGDIRTGAISTDETLSHHQTDELTTKIPDDFYVIYSENDVKSARVFQRVWRRVQSRKKLRDSTCLAGRAYTFFETCLGNLGDVKMRQMNRTCQYRWRYLSVVPYLLACIDIIHDGLHGAKRRAKQEMMRLEHKALDDLSETFDILNESIKHMKGFQEVFATDSSLHQRSDTDELRSQVEMLQTVLQKRKFPISIAQDVQQKLELVYMVVFKKPCKPTAKMPRKPKLAVDDDQYLAYEDVVMEDEDD